MDGRQELWGWLLLLLCSLLFLAAAIRDGDLLIAVASLVFLFACVLFLLASPKR